MVVGRCWKTIPILSYWVSVTFQGLCQLNFWGVIHICPNPPEECQGNQVTQLSHPHRTNSFRTALNCTFFHLGCRTKAAGRNTQQRCFLEAGTPLKFNMEPQEGDLIWKASFSGSMLNFGGCTPFDILALSQNYHELSKP